jgi:DNA (cytosine-5)-methyltransferase 1
MADTAQQRDDDGRRIELSQGCESRRLNGQWIIEPDVGRVAHGVPARVDRLRCLGNAVVPQVVEIIGRAIIESESMISPIAGAERGSG